MKILPLSDNNRKLSAHYIIRFFAKTIVYWNWNLSKVLINITKETFSKPSLMISNHQSYIDLMFLLMLHPKIVIVANKNAWQNRFFGPMIRFTDFIYVDKGLDDVVCLVKQRMEQGYSVLIFPEGTRSADCKITRFHKGAFYIAEQLSLKIKPIMLYGAGEAMGKNEFFLRRGSVHIKVFDDIDLKTGKWGNNYHEYTKGVLRFYRHEFEKLSREVKIPNRLKHNLINRYIYRGPILEWYLRVKLKLENNYNLINNIVPLNATITDLGCGYGFLSSQLALVSDNRKVLGIDYDENKIETAIHANEDLENLTFATGDVLKADLPQSDVIILSDVLHYMSKEKQSTLLEKCFLALKQDGIVIVRDADADLRKRTRGTQITEFFSTRFGFNKTIEKLDFVSGKSIIDAAKKFGLKTETIDDTKFTSNITYVLRK
jgi:1-acyl-sn-glycerol-3-phosphate acyltransferase